MELKDATVPTEELGVWDKEGRVLVEALLGWGRWYLVRFEKLCVLVKSSVRSGKWA